MISHLYILLVQRRYHSSEDYILIIRIITKPTHVTSLLGSLADQMSLVLKIERTKLRTENLTTLLNSADTLCDHLRINKSVIIMLGGIEYLEVDNINESMEGLLPILQINQIPCSLRHGFRLILTAELRITNCGQNSEGGILLPATSLNLEIFSKGVSGAFATCLSILTENNRMLTDEQMTEIHKTLGALSDSPELHLISRALSHCILLQDPSDKVIREDELIRQLKSTSIIESMHPSGYFFKEESLEMFLTILDTLSDQEDYYPGLTFQEICEILSMDDQIIPLQIAEKFSDEECPIFCDNVLIMLFLCSLRQSLLVHTSWLPLLSSLDGYFVYKHKLRHQMDHVRKMKAVSLIKEYFLSSGESSQDKSNEELRNCKRVMPTSQGIHFSKTCLNENEKHIHSGVTEFDVRYLRQMPLSLLHTKKFMEFASFVLFNYTWLYSKIFCLGVSNLLLDIDKFISMLNRIADLHNSSEQFTTLLFEVSALKGTIIHASDTLDRYPDNLATELIGQLLPLSNTKNDPENNSFSFIRSLVKQCYLTCPWYGLCIPTYAYPFPAGNPLLACVKCSSELLDLREFSPPSGKHEQIFLKLHNNPAILRYDFMNVQELHGWKSSCGHLYTAPNGKYAMILNEEHTDTLKIHQLDVQINDSVPLIGQINIGLWLKAIWSDVDPDESIKIDILKVDMTDTHVGLIVKTKDQRNYINHLESFSVDGLSRTDLLHVNENLTASYTNYVIVFELATGKLLHLLNPSPSANLIKFSQLFSYTRASPTAAVLEQSEIYKQDIFYTNSGNQILGFRLDSGEQFINVELSSVPRKLLISQDCTKLFTFTNESPCCMWYLKINSSGELSKSYRVWFEDIPKTDIIVDIKLSKYLPFIIIHAKHTVLIYDFEMDSVLLIIRRPMDIPLTFRLPNSKSQELVFTATEFALNDQIVLASIFCDVYVWDVRLGIPLVTLNSKIGLITRLFVVGNGGSRLIGYNDYLKELYLWDLPSAITNVTMIRRMRSSSFQSIQLNRMDCLTQSISYIVSAQNCNRIIGYCEHSDELGLFDATTGQLTDLFVQDGKIASAELSACGKYALVSLKSNELKKDGHSNMIWCLETRSILKEYGRDYGCPISFRRSPGKFLHLIKECEYYENETSSHYILVDINIQKRSHDVADVQMEVNQSLKLAHMCMNTKPFLTNNDQHLVILVPTHSEYQLHKDPNPHLVFWTILKSSTQGDCDGVLWKISSAELKEQLSHEDRPIRILNCVPGPNESCILIYYALLDYSNTGAEAITQYNSDKFSKGVILAELHHQDRPRGVDLVLLQSVSGLNKETPLNSIHFSPTKLSIYDSFLGIYYKNQNSLKNFAHLTLENSKPYFIVDNILDVNSKTGIRFHGFFLNENICIFSYKTLLHFIRPDTKAIASTIDTHHPITIVINHASNQRQLLVGCADGFLLSYHIIDPFCEALNSSSVSDLISQIPLHGDFCSAACDDKSQHNMESLPDLERSRSWDRELQPNPLTSKEPQS